LNYRPVFLTGSSILSSFRMFGVSRKFVLAVAAACCWAYSASAYVMSIDLGSEYMKVALVQPGKAFEV